MTEAATAVPFKDGLAFKGRVLATLETTEPEKVVLEGVDLTSSWEPCPTPRSQKWLGFIPKPRTWGKQFYRLTFERDNGVVNLGLQMILDRLYALPNAGGMPAAVGFIGIASDASAVTATTVFLGGAAAVITSGGTQNGFIRALASGGAAATSRTAQTVDGGATFTQADMAGAAFAIHKLAHMNSVTDAGTGLGAGPAAGILDVIGGSGAAPFNTPFTIDLTTITTWSLTLRIQMSAVNL